MNLVLEALQDLLRFGHEDLVSTATMVVTGQDPAANPETAIGHLRRHADQRQRRGESPLWRSVVTVPYDEAAGAVGQMIFADLASATQLAYTKVAAHTAQSFAELPSRDRRGGMEGHDGWFGPTARRPASTAVRQLRPADRGPDFAGSPSERSGS
jgi:hypothetical protein